jgi:predicted metal-dependent phosphoesterase TrpH
MDPLEMIERARAAGLDGVVITEHDYQWRADELAGLAKSAGGLMVLSGVEVSAREGHFLVYGLPDLADAPPGIALGDLLRLVERHQAAVVAAHPFRWGQPFEAIVAQHGPVFHGVEYVSNNVTPETRALTDALLRTLPTPATGSSDAHDAETLGCYYSEIDAPVASIADFVSALRRGKVRPRHRVGVRLSSGPVD